MTASTAQTTRKLTKGEQTAMRIQEAAVDLVLENGIDGATVDKICQLANVSERTFFNHFKTKELAIIGDDLPTIDEVKARAFLASPPGDIFTDALALIPQPNSGSEFHSLMFKRLQMLRKYPSLLAAQMEKMLATRDEHTELVYLRLSRTYSETHSEDQLRTMASQISEIVGSMFRSRVEQGIINQSLPPQNPPQGLGETIKYLVELGLKA